MGFYQFMKEIEDILNQMDREEMYHWIYEYAGTLNESSREKFMESFHTRKTSEEIIFHKEELEELIREIADGEVYLTAEVDYYFDECLHDYEDEISYSDDFNIVPQIAKYIGIANQYIHVKSYREAYDILSKLEEMVIIAENSEGDDPDFLTIIDLYDNDLLDIDIQEYEKAVLYTMLQEHEPFPTIYGTFEKFETIVLSDVLAFGPEEIQNIDSLVRQWIDFLKTKDGKSVEALLQDACQYLSDNELLALARECYSIHPSLYRFYCEKMFQSNEIDEGKKIALEAIKMIPVHYQIRSEIADLAILYCGEPYFYEVAFLSNPTAFHCLRLYDQDIELSHIRKEMQTIDYSIYPSLSHELRTAYLSQDTIQLYIFLLGDCENIMDETGSVFLNLLLMLMKPEDHCYQADCNLLRTIEWGINFKSLDSNDFQTYFQQFKKKYQLSVKFKSQCILWLQNQVGANAESIVGGGDRKHYHYVADQIVVLAQILEKERLVESVSSYVEMYKNEYASKRAFKAEINERMEIMN